MTNEEVISQLESLKRSNEDFVAKNPEPESIWQDDITSLNIAIDAVKKQMPMNVKNNNAFGECPQCGADFNSELRSEYEIVYCPYCGQWVDWSEPETINEFPQTIKQRIMKTFCR